MGTETKRPTAQDIEDARKVVGATVDNVARACIEMGDPKILINSVSRWRPVLRALDYAADRLRAEEEGERVPEVDHDSGQRVVELTWDGRWLTGPDGPAYGIVLPGGVWAYYEGGGLHQTACGREPTQTAARIAVEALLPPHCKVTNPETPQQAVPEQPPTNPEARVRAMSDEEVDAELTWRGVSGWCFSARGNGEAYRPWDEGWDAIAPDGVVYRPEPHSVAYDDYKAGDTTTTEGRAECSRRLLVHLLREEG